MNATFLASVPVFVLLVACSSDSEPQRLPPGSSAATATPHAEDPKATSAPAPVPVPAPAPASATALAFTTQPGWVVEKPSSAARKAQYRLPKADADTEDATLVVTYFGANGAGPIELNIQRWADQFKQPDGRPSAEVMTHTSRSVNGMQVEDVDVSGTFLGSGMPGAAPTPPKDGWRMLASVIESDHGPYFAKLAGPQATIAKWEASYRAFISGLKPAK